MTSFNWTRRDLLKTGAAAIGAPAMTAVAAPKGKAAACTFLWRGGGAAHMDTFDPKVRGDGNEKPGAYYDSIATAIPGARVCEHLRNTAPLLDRCVLVRSLNHTISGEH